MMKMLETSMPMAFLEKLQEYTDAKARHAFLQPNEVTPRAHQRLIGHARQEAVQEGFRLAAISEGMKVVDFSPQRGMPSRFIIDFGEYNLIAIKNQAKSPRKDWECKALAMIANEKHAKGAEVIDLFSGKRIIEGQKPLIAWTAVWNSSRGAANSLPVWTGFTQLEATSEKRVRSIGRGLSYQDMRALLITKTGTVGEKQIIRPKYYPKANKSDKINDKGED